MNKLFALIRDGWKRLIQGVADYTRETNKMLLILCITASLMGCGLIYSAIQYAGSPRTVVTQFAAMVLGVFVAIIISLFDYKTISKRPWIFWVLTILLLLITYFFGYAPEGTENKAWIELPYGMSLQVSELIKLFMILIFSHAVQNIPPDEINRPKNLGKLLLIGLLPCVLVMGFQKDLGNVIIMLFIFAFMLFAAGVKLRYFAIGAGVLALVSPLLWFFGLSEYQRQRFAIILDLESDAKGLGYQQLQGLNAIGSGGLFGEGYLHGTYIQSGSVPKSYNDFIFTVAGNEFGLVGCLVIIAILAAIVIRIIWIGVHARDVQGKIICFGAFGLLSSQILINIGMVLSIMPVIGVTLPFFSAGGSSLVMLFACIGLVLSVYTNRNKRLVYLHD